MKRYLIFTDLDGTLLDHENYSYGNNKKLISSIISKQNEIIINTSKTFSECKYLLKELKLTNMPFSTENGAVLYFPKNRFKKIKIHLIMVDIGKLELLNYHLRFGINFY